MDIDHKFNMEGMHHSGDHLSILNTKFHKLDIHTIHSINQHILNLLYHQLNHTLHQLISLNQCSAKSFNHLKETFRVQIDLELLNHLNEMSLCNHNKYPVHLKYNHLKKNILHMKRYKNDLEMHNNLKDNKHHHNHIKKVKFIIDLRYTIITKSLIKNIISSSINQIITLIGRFR